MDLYTMDWNQEHKNKLITYQQFVVRQHHHHLRAFATAFGQRSPFFDPRLVDPLREWERFRRKTAEQWALELPRRIGATPADLTQTFNFAAGDHPHWFDVQRPLLPYFTLGGVSRGRIRRIRHRQRLHCDHRLQPRLASRLHGSQHVAQFHTHQRHHPTPPIFGLHLQTVPGQPRTGQERTVPDAEQQSVFSHISGRIRVQSRSTISRRRKMPVTTSLQVPRTNIPVLPGASTSTISVNHASYLLASQSYYGSNGTPAAAGMYLGPSMVPPSLLYPQLYQQSHLHPSIHLLGNDARNSYDVAAAMAAQHEEAQQQINNAELLNKELQSPSSDEPRSDGSGTNGHVSLPSTRERAGRLEVE
ncbi:uncharacterized protein CEXT_188531 [Caerostris extrusa]|uniref:Uncharacterized protein n=1 Tax=Caerostris extrusa TaxID=172846 RepID=A0AAV4U9Z9_CAEEX|nr:uncharacterized protein CEXT_188531 [Caerostris extrusa]